jgi:hypothetical protein
MSDIQTTEPTIASPVLTEGWVEATHNEAPGAKYKDQAGTYFDENNKIIAFTQPDGTVTQAK